MSAATGRKPVTGKMPAAPDIEHVVAVAVVVAHCHEIVHLNLNLLVACSKRQILTEAMVLPKMKACWPLRKIQMPSAQDRDPELVGALAAR